MAEIVVIQQAFSTHHKSFKMSSFLSLLLGMTTRSKINQGESHLGSIHSY